MVVQYSGLVRRINSEAALCRRPRMNVVVLLSKKGKVSGGSGSCLNGSVKYAIQRSGTKCKNDIPMKRT